MEQLTIVRTVRSGLVSMIPILLVGAFALVFKTFPIDAYQRFIENFANGALMSIFNFIFSATFGALSVYMTFFISKAYVDINPDPDIPRAGAAASSLLAFLILAGSYTESFGADSIGPKSMFIAIITGICTSKIYLTFYHRLNERRSRRILSRGADKDFTKAMFSLAPMALTAIAFALINICIVRVFNVESCREFMITALSRLFEGGAPTYTKGLLFVSMSSLLWFFGIHGSDVLEDTMQKVFASGLEINQAAVEAGMEPTRILSKQFFDCFVLMGGCGASICLLIAILIGSKNRSRRELGIAATGPMIFNINEIMVFGLPVIYNPIMFVPFILVPILCYTTAYIATDCGIVPVITGNIEWTTPILLGGYQATGSIAGSLLQLFNVVLGTAIYIPFVKMLDKQSETEAKTAFQEFMTFCKENEQKLSAWPFLDMQNSYGEIARTLTADIHYDMPENVILNYQPQYDYDGNCIGVEALLRLDHSVCGAIYPPLAVKLAEEGGFLFELEKSVLLKVLEDKEKIEKKFGSGIKISFNVTGTTVVSKEFLQFCEECAKNGAFKDINLCIEITEQATLDFNETTQNALQMLRSLGLSLAIDDFSMGHTSINYLKTNLFDYIKLDGSLVRGLTKKENCREIILSITQLAASLGMTVIAEFVETAEIRDMLHEMGCNCYQGWLYSPSVPV